MGIRHNMSGLTRPSIAQRALQAIKGAVKPAAAAPSVPSGEATTDAEITNGIKAPDPAPEHGNRIYVFAHYQRQHVVYSLTKALKVSFSPSIEFQLNTC